MTRINCTGTEHLGPMIERHVDDRTLTICRRCHAFSYSPRGWANSYTTVVDPIVEGVAARGVHEIHTAFLLNGTFPKGPNRPPFWDQLRAWAAQHLLRYEQRSDMMRFERDGAALRRVLDEAQSLAPQA